MSGPDFETLLRSPLEDDPEPTGWGSAVAGFVGGVALVVAASAVFGLGTATTDEAPGIDSVTPATTVEEQPTESGVYPPGFVEVTESIALKPIGTVEGDEGLTVSLAMAEARDSDPTGTPVPIGGAWHLERGDGSVVTATRLVYDRFHPDVIGVGFPGALRGGDVLRMVERWDPVEREALTETGFTGTPFALEDPIEIDLGHDLIVRLDTMELGRHLGRIEWTLAGPGDPTASVAFNVSLFDEAAGRVGSYEPQPAPRDPTRSHGVTSMHWGPGFDVHPDEAATVRVTVLATFPDPHAVDVVFDVEPPSDG